MRSAIFAHFDNGGERLGPATRQAIEQLQKSTAKLTRPPMWVSHSFWAVTHIDTMLRLPPTHLGSAGRLTALSQRKMAQA
jgi:hypothetical protein